jgi:hypothetical protein
MVASGTEHELPPIAFPALALSSGNSVFLLASRDDVQRLTRCSRYAFVTGYHDRLAVWDAAGVAWPVAVTPEPPLGRFARFLARTVYNPVMSVKVTFGAPRRFELEELKARLRELIRRDDDALTQSVSPARLTRLVDLADGPERLIRVLEKHDVV